MQASKYFVLGLLAGMLVLAGVWHRGSTIDSSVPFLVAEAAAAHPEGTAWTAEDLREIADYYDRQADTVRAQAIEFERTAASITPLTDTKGFRRSALTVAASMRWKEASELRRMAADHREEGARLLAKAKGE